MNLIILILCLALGVIMTFHAAMNARIGTITGDPIFTNMVFWILGTIVAVISWLVRPEKISAAEVAAVPYWLYTAGIFGVFVSLAIIFLIPRAGIANFTILILAGQLVCSAVLSHTGYLSDAVVRMDFTKLAGFVLVFVGSWLVVFR